MTTLAVRQGIEALLFLADEPVDPATLAELVGTSPDEAQATCEALATDYEEQERGLAVRASAGGWRMYTAPIVKPVVERWALLGRSGRLTQAALETLAVIAYKQPIGRQEIGDIRGVNADGAVRSLVARGFVAEVGRDPGPGQALLYGTTRLFLERLGLDSLDELPPLTDYLPEAPAPDEPQLDTLREVRRRLAAGGDLPSRPLGGRSDAQTNTGGGEAEGDDHDVLPPPDSPVGARDADDAGMDELTERLDVAARNAVGQLRAAMAASETSSADDAATTAAEDDADETGHAGGGERSVEGVSAPEGRERPADDAGRAGGGERSAEGPSAPEVPERPPDDAGHAGEDAEATGPTSGSGEEHDRG